MSFFNPYYIARNIIVSLDFDGVLAHGLKVKIKYSKQWFGMNLKLSQTKKEGFEALANHMEKKNINYRSLMDPLNEKHIMEYIVPDGCLCVLNKLHSEGFRFVIITSRNNHDYPYAKKFVKHKFGHLIKNIHNTKNQPKNQFVHRLKPRIHIDDGLKKLIELSNEPISLCYYRQPENIHKNLPLGTSRIHEIHNWKQFYEFCNNLKILHEAICWKYKIHNNYMHNTQIVRLLNQMPNNAKKELLNEYKLFKKKYVA